MPTDYSWFAATLNLTKKYRFATTWHRYYSKSIERGGKSDLGLPERKWFDITRDNPYEDYIEVVGNHSMNPAVPDGAMEIEREFSVKLPVELHDFYKLWGGGFLMLCEFYYILSPKEVVSVSKQYREDREETALAWDVFRFCDVGNGDFLGFYYRERSWQIIFMSRESTDEMILNGESRPYVLGGSFHEWLKSTIERDGEFSVPGLGSPWYKDGSAAYERLE